MSFRKLYTRGTEPYVLPKALHSGNWTICPSESFTLGELNHMSFRKLYSRGTEPYVLPKALHSGNWTICPLARKLDDPPYNEIAFPQTSSTWPSHRTENFRFHLDVETRDTLGNVVGGLRFDLKLTTRLDLSYLCFIWLTFNSWDYGLVATSDETVSNELERIRKSSSAVLIPWGTDKNH